jgi:ribonuclease R
VKALRFIAERLGDEFEGTITGVVPVGVFVELDEIPVDGFVRVATYVDDDFRLDEAGVRLVGRRTRARFSMGDRLIVRVARVDVPARELELALDRPHAAHAMRRAGKQRRPAPRGRRTRHQSKGRTKA